MTILLGFLAFFLLLDVAALTGWAPSTRDGRDWRTSADVPVTGTVASTDSTARSRHAQQLSGVVSSEPGGSRPDAACDRHATAA